MPTTPRERARTETMAQIVRIGRAHLDRDGAAALSLRAVARDLGVVSSAVYRYVASREELLTLLIVDAYDELGDAVDAAIAAAGDDPSGQFRAAAGAIRDWALAERPRYALLFGTPVAGYDAPAEQTSGPGTRVIVALAHIWERANTRGVRTPTEARPELPASLRGDIERIRQEYRLEAEDDLILRGLHSWAALFGLVSWEVFDQYGAGTISDPAALFDYQLDLLAATLGLPA